MAQAKIQVAKQAVRAAAETADITMLAMAQLQVRQTPAVAVVEAVEV